MKAVKKKRVLKKWVKKTLEFMAMIVICFSLSIGLIVAMAEAHDQRLNYYSELVANGD